jgi:integrase
LKTKDKRIKAEREDGNKFRQQRCYALLPQLMDYHFADHLESLMLRVTNTGMRKGELFSLRWENIDLTNSVITVKAKNAKSGKARHIPLNQNAKQAVIKWQSDVAKAMHHPKAIYLALGDDEPPKASGYVFEGEANKPITDVKKAWLTC